MAKRVETFRDVRVLPTREAACIGKDAFATRGLAEKVAKRVAKRGGQPPQPYKCRFCSQYHVGRPGDSEKRPPPRAR